MSVIRLISMAAAVAALSTACRSGVSEQPKRESNLREPSAAAPAATQAGKSAQPAGMCAETEQPESCGCSHGHPKIAVDTAGRQVVPMSQAKVGDLTTCPVMNNVFEVLPDSPKLEVGGKTYYFCCDGCADKFKENPSRFISS